MNTKYGFQPYLPFPLLFQSQPAKPSNTENHHPSPQYRPLSNRRTHQRTPKLRHQNALPLPLPPTLTPLHHLHLPSLSTTADEKACTNNLIGHTPFFLTSRQIHVKASTLLWSARHLHSRKSYSSTLFITANHVGVSLHPAPNPWLKDVIVNLPCMCMRCDSAQDAVGGGKGAFLGTARYGMGKGRYSSFFPLVSCPHYDDFAFRVVYHFHIIAAPHASLLPQNLFSLKWGLWLLTGQP